MINLTSFKFLEGKYVVLGAVDKNSIPNIVAVELNKVIIPDKILITDNFFNKTKVNLKNNPYISISFWTKKPLSGHQFKGKAKYFLKGKYSNLLKRLNPGLPCKCYVLITITEIWDLANPKLLCSSKT